MIVRLTSINHVNTACENIYDKCIRFSNSAEMLLFIDKINIVSLLIYHVIEYSSIIFIAGLEFTQGIY